MNGRVQVKICGMQPGDDLSFASHHLVTHVGIIFVEKSRRYVDPAAASRLVQAVGRRARTVGVFAHHDYDAILDVVGATGIDCVQLHGDESPELCKSLRSAGIPVWKAIPVPLAEPNVEQIVSQIQRYRETVDGLLFDAKVPSVTGVTGGHGQSFDWSILDVISQYLYELPWFVAGGLTPENVGRLLKSVKPTGIDISSGVETNGRKDPARIRQLLESVSTDN
ncbi:phosphoribosylanthranilate isomerase [Alicyclobacillus acidiphilus]|uniref:phosphoribosylanthranilate isomerase n=1 Tax=Alicyclobacillus acidiphilus TaxID=182455 RepID=UPI00082C2416|nr:phosphoribosylanthranilate isomerase [Alicyclobacillus acidiphilus]